MILKDDKIPSLNGLVLAGGKSIRMGTKKDLIKWHGKEQRYFAADMLNNFCDQVFISCLSEQSADIDTHYQALTDSFLNMGPLSGILSAFRLQRDKAWLVIACDLPLLNIETIRFLIENRDIQKMATTYKNPHDNLPEPLITIWEPRSYAILLNYLGNGIICPRKSLINENVKILQALDSQTLMNVNTPQDAAKAKEIFNAKNHKPR